MGNSMGLDYNYHQNLANERRRYEAEQKRLQEEKNKEKEAKYMKKKIVKNGRFDLAVIGKGEWKHDFTNMYKWKQTILMFAIMNKKEITADRLLDYPDLCELDAKDAKGNNALMLACEFRMEDIALKIIALNKIKLNDTNALGNTAMMIAFGGCEKVVAKLGKDHAKECALDAQNNYGETLMTMCVKLNVEGMFDILMENDAAGLLIQDGKGNTPLLLACSIKKENYALAMLEHTDSCGLGLANDDGNIEFDYALFNNMHTVVKKILEVVSDEDRAKYFNRNYGKFTPLEQACILKCEETALILLNYPKLCRLDHSTDDALDNALMLACRFSLKKIINRLLEDDMVFMFDMGKKNINGETALHLVTKIKLEEEAKKIINIAQNTGVKIEDAQLFEIFGRVKLSDEFVAMYISYRENCHSERNALDTQSHI